MKSNKNLISCYRRVIKFCKSTAQNTFFKLLQKVLRGLKLDSFSSVYRVFQAEDAAEE